MVLERTSIETTIGKLSGRIFTCKAKIHFYTIFLLEKYVPKTTARMDDPVAGCFLPDALLHQRLF